MNSVEWDQYIGVLKDALSGDGALLLTRDKDGRANPMTIGWAQVGIVWGRSTLTVLVRKSRYTYSCLLTGMEFTINVPAQGTLSEELLYCGTKSGRDVDKVDACGLTLKQARKVQTPIIEQCQVHYECRIVLRKQLSVDDFSAPAILDEYYQDNDHHMIVTGEILAVHGS